MLDSNSDILNKTEDNRSDEACYGGFGRRLSYERWCRSAEKGSLKRLAPRLTLIVGVTLFFGLLGVLCSIAVFHLVRENSEIYYPNTAEVENLQTSDTAQLFSSKATPTSSQVIFMKNSVAAENVSHEISRRYRIPIGVMIHEVFENSAAHTAGLMAGDIIVAVNGTAATDITSIDSMLEKLKLGTVVKFTVFRDDTYVDLNLSIE
ncbi:MAG: PDZ domain-containing protein [Clostridia bacterium]|nr:PDZ domain-containing protein [Clostridia bacterium]